VHPRQKGILFIVAAAMLWSSGGIGIKAISEPALNVAFYRSLFAGIALLALSGRDVWGRRRWKSTPLFAGAVISYAACLITFVVATKWTTAANAIFLQYAGVVWVLLFSPIVTKEPMRMRDAAAIAVAFSGMALFFVGRFSTRGMAGNMMALTSSVFFAALILAMRRENHAAQSVIIWGNILVAAALLPFVAGNLSLTAKSFTVLLLLGLFQVALPYVLFARGLRYVTATQASLTGMIEPIANPIWVFLVLGERPAPLAIAGAAVVLCAIAWHTLTGGPSTELPALD
jgi:DME family drug/metabolite transporter